MREREVDIRELQEQLRAYADVIDTTRTNVLDVAQELANAARALRALLFEEAQMQRKLALIRGIRPDQGEFWEHYRIRKRSRAARCAASASNATTRLSRPRRPAEAAAPASRSSRGSDEWEQFSHAGGDLSEVIIAAFDSEAVAEVFASRLRAEGIEPRVFYASQAGIPRQIAPSGLGFGPGAFRVAVA